LDSHPQGITKDVGKALFLLAEPLCWRDTLSLLFRENKTVTWAFLASGESGDASGGLRWRHTSTTCTRSPCLRTDVHKYTFTVHTYTFHSHIHTYTRAHVHTYTRTHVHTYNTCSCTHTTRTHVHTYTHNTCSCTHTTRTHVHKTHIHISTRTHTYCTTCLAHVQYTRINFTCTWTQWVTYAAHTYTRGHVPLFTWVFTYT
jgi:hypothetical protein